MSETLVSLWTRVRGRLQAAGVDSPVFDARLLVEAGAGVSRLDIVTDPRRPVSEAQVDAVEALTARRASREPVAYILGRKNFWTLDLIVNPAVLAPRPETETLVMLALELIPPDAPVRILDMGVGSGAILLSVLSERPRASGVGVDISVGALEVAQANAITHNLAARVSLVQGDWAEEIEGGFDVVLSNPPYIPTGDIDTLAPEVARFEPRTALDGGPDGLDAYRTILGRADKLVRPGGAIVFEVGAGQAEDVAAMMRAAGLQGVENRRDLAGTSRVVWGRRTAGG